jgi:Tn3 transposase DDE domain
VTVDCRTDLILQLQLHGVFILQLRGGARDASCHGAGTSKDVLGGRLLHNEGLADVSRGRLPLAAPAANESLAGEKMRRLDMVGGWNCAGTSLAKLLRQLCRGRMVQLCHNGGVYYPQRPPVYGYGLWQEPHLQRSKSEIRRTQVDFRHREGVLLAYEDSYQGSSPIVFIHGWAAIILMFVPGQALSKWKRANCSNVTAKGKKDQLGAIGLVVNMIVLWNTIYIEAALEQLQKEG